MSRATRQAWLTSHPVPRFLVVGGVSVVVDVGLLRLLHGSLDVPLLVATTLAIAASIAVNFGLNRHWVFTHGKAGSANPQFVRFVILCVLNWLSTLAIVGGLSAAGLHYLLAKAVAIVINAVANYVAYGRWVFRA